MVQRCVREGFGPRPISLVLKRSVLISFSKDTLVIRRGGRVVYCTCLENKSVARHREFESHPLRQLGNEVIGSPVFDPDGLRPEWATRARQPFFGEKFPSTSPRMVSLSNHKPF